ncbi:MAG: tRNA-dihydrouridine synthase family protein [Treponema sp.]
MKFVLAPMANLTHSALRILIHLFADPDEYFSEMIHAPSLLAGGHFEEWYLRTAPAPEKLVWQLTSHKTEALIQAVPLVLAHGGIGIDLNMGCCAPPIVRSGAGFAWMLKPLAETADMVHRVKAAITTYEQQHNRGHAIRLSVKLRLGQTEDYPFLLNFCRMLIDNGVELVTIHPRLQRQSYGRPALHEYTARLAQDSAIPVYGNGDVDSYKKWEILQSRYPCSGWMIGRAAVQKPWIFYQLRTHAHPVQKEPVPNPAAVEDMCAYTQEFPLITPDHTIDMLNTAYVFLKLLETEQPPAFHRTRAQRFFHFFSENFSFAHYCKTKLLHAENFTAIQEILQTYFTEVPDDRFIPLIPE